MRLRYRGTSHRQVLPLPAGEESSDLFQFHMASEYITNLDL